VSIFDLKIGEKEADFVAVSIPFSVGHYHTTAHPSLRVCVSQISLAFVGMLTVLSILGCIQSSTSQD
jgi:hypothetical protein